MPRRETPADPLFIGDKTFVAPVDADASAVNSSGQTVSLIDGKYKPVKELGKGGMGSVYLVEQVHLRTQFALKTLLPECTSPKTLMRFQQEARAASLLDHPGLIKVHDFGMFGDRPYFVMDYIDGESLAERIGRCGPLEIESATAILAKVAHALAYAHERGIVHRDLKPSNIMLVKSSGSSAGADAPMGTSLDVRPAQRPNHATAATFEEEQVKIVDFGIAKLITDQQQDNLTRTGEVFGSPSYMSPEQCLGTQVDHRSDVYSFGCVLFEALTGFPPFVADSALALMMKHQSEPPVSLKETTLGKEFPADLEAIVSKLLAKNPDDRYGNMSAVAQDLERVGGVKEQTKFAKGSQQLKAKARDTKCGGNTKQTLLRVAPYLIGVLVFAIGFLASHWTAVAPHAVQESTNPPERENQIPKGQDSSPKDATQILREQKTAETAAYYESFSNPNFKFSEIHPDGTRVFHFPPHAAIGEIVYLPLTHLKKNEHAPEMTPSRTADGKTIAVAKGTVTIKHFRPFDFAVFLADNPRPEILRACRSDEVGGLRFSVYFSVDNEDASSGGMLKYIPNLKSLRSLSLDHIKVPSNYVDYFSNLDKITNFTASPATESTKSLAKWSRLNSLLGLELSHVHDVSPVLRALKNSMLGTLILEDCNLTDEDLKVIGENCPHLNYLAISNNKKVTEVGIGYLCKYPAFRHLIAFDCSIKPDAYKSLVNVPNLIEVGMSGESWPPAARQKFEDALRKKCTYGLRLGVRPWKALFTGSDEVTKQK